MEQPFRQRRQILWSFRFVKFEQSDKQKAHTKFMRDMSLNKIEPFVRPSV